MTHTQRQALQGLPLPGPNTRSAQNEFPHVRIDAKHHEVAASKRASTRGPHAQEDSRPRGPLSMPSACTASSPDLGSNGAPSPRPLHAEAPHALLHHPPPLPHHPRLAGCHAAPPPPPAFWFHKIWNQNLPPAPRPEHACRPPRSPRRRSAPTAAAPRGLPSLALVAPAALLLLAPLCILVP